MKKIKTLLIIVCLCAFVLSCAAQCFTVAADRTNTISLIDLVRIKKYLAGIPVETGMVDYNRDKEIDSRDLVYLIDLIMSGETEIPNVDFDGFFNQVVKP